VNQQKGILHRIKTLFSQPTTELGRNFEALKILGPNIISIHKKESEPYSRFKQLKFHVLEDTNGVPKIVETKINENIADKLSSCLKQHYYRIEHFRYSFHRHRKFTRYITWSPHHQAILCRVMVYRAQCSRRAQLLEVF
jgi:hypothetical protein